MSDLEIPDLAELGLPGALAGAGALGLYWTLGPSIKAVGNAFGTWTEYRMNNLLRIGEKVAGRAEQFDGGIRSERRIHPRLAADLIENASWIDDDLHQEYFAGLIAGETSESDDGLFYSRIVAGLTAKQVRLHFIIYRSYEGSFAAVETPRFNGGEQQLRQLTVLAPKSAFAHAMGLESVSNLGGQQPYMGWRGRGWSPRSLRSRLEVTRSPQCRACSVRSSTTEHSAIRRWASTRSARIANNFAASAATPTRSSPRARPV